MYSSERSIIRNTGIQVGMHQYMTPHPHHDYSGRKGWMLWIVLGIPFTNNCLSVQRQAGNEPNDDLFLVVPLRWINIEIGIRIHQYHNEKSTWKTRLLNAYVMSRQRLNCSGLVM